jgi:hypothetical protein
MSVVAESSPQLPSFSADKFAHYCTSLVNRVSDAYWEARFGVRTKGDQASDHPDANRYGYLAFHTYFRILDRFALTRRDVVVDLGCGKGRTVCAAASYRVRKVVGVEIDPALHHIAETNAAWMRCRRAPVRIVHQSAVDFDYDPATAIVMFHPFGAETMSRVLDRIEASLAARPRRLQIAYANPVHGALLAARPWLTLVDAWTPGRWSRLKFPVQFYASI